MMERQQGEGGEQRTMLVVFHGYGDRRKRGEGYGGTGQAGRGRAGH